MMRIAHCMIRVGDLGRSLDFYVNILGMKLLRREEYPDGRFTLAFVGYDDIDHSCVIELTYNWDTSLYSHGDSFGHLAFEVDDVFDQCSRLAAAGVRVVRPAGPMAHASPDREESEIIAFVEDPDGYRIELVQSGEERRR